MVSFQRHFHTLVKQSYKKKGLFFLLKLFSGVWLKLLKYIFYIVIFYQRKKRTNLTNLLGVNNFPYKIYRLRYTLYIYKVSELIKHVISQIKIINLKYVTYFNFLIKFVICLIRYTFSINSVVYAIRYTSFSFN